MTKQITAKEIHKDFYSAEERLYVDAIGLTQRPPLKKVLRVERFHKIGFGCAKPVKEGESIVRRQQNAEGLISAIDYFRQHYPNNKFITEEETETLCKKYGLLLGESGSYTGDIPEKNLIEIEKFVLRKEDEHEKITYEIFTDWGRTDFRRMILGTWNVETGSVGFNYEHEEEKPKKKGKKETEKRPFKICAPQQDFNTLGSVDTDGYKLVYDPIVLQPVLKNKINGYLIVTAWGDEASDEIVVNEKMN